jgi:hypothetical protein
MQTKYFISTFNFSRNSKMSQFSINITGHLSSQLEKARQQSVVPPIDNNALVSRLRPSDSQANASAPSFAISSFEEGRAPVSLTQLDWSRQSQIPEVFGFPNFQVNSRVRNASLGDQFQTRQITEMSSSPQRSLNGGLSMQELASLLRNHFRVNSFPWYTEADQPQGQARRAFFDFVELFENNFPDASGVELRNQYFLFLSVEFSQTHPEIRDHWNALPRGIRAQLGWRSLIDTTNNREGRGIVADGLKAAR